MDLVETTRTVAADIAGLGREALRVHIGLAVMILAALLLKRPVGDWRPLAAVALAALAAPLWAIVDQLSHGRTPRWTGEWAAIATMLFWPTILFVLARFTKVMKR